MHVFQWTPPSRELDKYSVVQAMMMQNVVIMITDVLTQL
jgi:hypothetical protein